MEAQGSGPRLCSFQEAGLGFKAGQPDSRAASIHNTSLSILNKAPRETPRREDKSGPCPAGPPSLMGEAQQQQQQQRRPPYPCSATASHPGAPGGVPLSTAAAKPISFSSAKSSRAPRAGFLPLPGSAEQQNWTVMCCRSNTSAGARLNYDAIPLHSV